MLCAFFERRFARCVLVSPQLVLQYSGEGINRVLRLLASRERHPVALYCTAGLCELPFGGMYCLCRLLPLTAYQNRHTR